MGMIWSDRLSKGLRKTDEAEQTISAIAEELKRAAFEFYSAEGETLLAETIRVTVQPANFGLSDGKVVTFARLSFRKCDIAIVMPGLPVTFNTPNRT